MVIFPLKRLIFPVKFVIVPLKRLIFPVKVVIFPLNMLIFPVKNMIFPLNIVIFHSFFYVDQTLPPHFSMASHGRVTVTPLGRQCWARPAPPCA